MPTKYGSLTAKGDKDKTSDTYLEMTEKAFKGSKSLSEVDPSSSDETWNEGRIDCNGKMPTDRAPSISEENKEESKKTMTHKGRDPRFEGRDCRRSPILGQLAPLLTLITQTTGGRRI